MIDGHVSGKGEDINGEYGYEGRYDSDGNIKFVKNIKK